MCWICHIALLSRLRNRFIDVLLIHFSEYANYLLSHTLNFNMQPRRGEHIPEKKRKINTVNTEPLETIPTSALPEEHFMFLQIIDVFPRYYLVKIDPVEDKIIYEDLLEFERSKITINICQFEPESLYILYEGNVYHPKQFTI